MQNIETLKVVVRVRPLIQYELYKNGQEIIDVTGPSELSIKNVGKQTDEQFKFDAVYDQNSTQSVIYQDIAYPMVQACFQGYNATIFTYGQPASGKTYTIVGDKNVGILTEQDGIIPRSFQTIFENVSPENLTRQYQIKCSYCEIYKEEIRDLLSQNPNNILQLKENQDKVAYVNNLTIMDVNSLSDIQAAFEQGNSNRQIKQNSMNARCLRSHSIFTVYIEVTEVIEGVKKTRIGKLNLVDLAGIERLIKGCSSANTFKEVQKINLSHLALGKIVSALIDEKSSYIPYRESKLTRLLQDSLGGNAKTVMIVAVSPAECNFQETIQTLELAAKAQFIENKPKINEFAFLLDNIAQEVQKQQQQQQESQKIEKQLVESTQV